MANVQVLAVGSLPFRCLSSHHSMHRHNQFLWHPTCKVIHHSTCHGSCCSMYDSHPLTRLNISCIDSQVWHQMCGSQKTKQIGIQKYLPHHVSLHFWSPGSCHAPEGPHNTARTITSCIVAQDSYRLHLGHQSQMGWQTLWSPSSL